MKPFSFFKRKVENKTVRIREPDHDDHIDEKMSKVAHHLKELHTLTHHKGKLHSLLKHHYGDDTAQHIHKAVGDIIKTHLGS